MTETHCDELPQDQWAQTPPPPPPPPPTQQRTPLTIELQVPPLLQVAGAVQVKQFPSVPVQPVSQLLGMQAASIQTAISKTILFTYGLIPVVHRPERLRKHP